MSVVTPEIRSLARWLLEHEAGTGPPRAEAGSEAVRVCEKFRGLLSTLMGAGGAAALLSRALILAKAEAPSLDGAQVTPDGALDWPATTVPRDNTDSRTGEEALVAHMLGLLATFIGQPLTLHLIKDLWQDAPCVDTNSEPEMGR